MNGKDAARVQKDKASRYRDLAAIPEEKFETFLEGCAKRQQIPREKALLRFALEPALAGRKTPKARPAHSTAMTPAMADAIQRCLGHVDVCVGASLVNSRVQVNPATVRTEQLRGTVLVAECPDPDSSLAKLSSLRAAARIDDVVVVLPGTTGAEWFRRLAEDHWTCCFAAGPHALVLAHLGRMHAAFRLACGALGPVMGSS